jgi:hypothetical protein
VVDISELNEPAREAAKRAEAHGLTLTSGKRSVDQQAHAMAVNVHNDPHYLHIYASQAVKDCQGWVDEWLKEHPGQHVDVDECKAHLLSALDGKWGEVSFHLTGDAFDCSPHGTDEQKAFLEKMVQQIKDSGGEAKFLDSEHGDPAWHVQCRGGSLPDEAHEPEPQHAASSHAYPGSPLRHGSRGDEVRLWQERLHELGHDVSVDGDFGDRTHAATESLQQQKGLTVDGVVGEHTWAAAFG